MKQKTVILREEEGAVKNEKPTETKNEKAKCQLNSHPKWSNTVAVSLLPAHTLKPRFPAVFLQTLP